MKIDPKDLDHVNRYSLMLGFLSPRPIAWVSTISKEGRFNVAPFSSYMGVCSNPVMVGFQAVRRRGQKKDTVRNIEATKEFVVNVVTESLVKCMIRTGADYPPDVDEFVEAGLTPAASDKVRPPRVHESPINMECKMVKILEFGEMPYMSSFVIGEVVQIHIADELYKEGKIDSTHLHLVGRLWGDFYCRVNEGILEVKRYEMP